MTIITHYYLLKTVELADAATRGNCQKAEKNEINIWEINIVCDIVYDIVCDIVYDNLQ